MEIGIVGPCGMGGDTLERLVGDGHEVVDFDIDASGVEEAVDDGARGAGSLADPTEVPEPPRAVIASFPHGGPTRGTAEELAELLEEGDVIVDGGSSRFTDATTGAS